MIPYWTIERYARGASNAACMADTVQQSGVLTIVHLQQLVQKINEIIAEYADADML